MKYPDEKRMLVIRPCVKTICLNIKPAARLLAHLLYLARFCSDDEATFTVSCTQQEIIEGLIEEIDIKTLHRTAIPVLRLLGFLDVDGASYRYTYTVHLDLIQHCLEHCNNKEQLDKILIVSMRWQFDKCLIQIDKSPIELVKSPIEFDKCLIPFRQMSNSKRGRKPRPQAALEANSENTENQRDILDNIEIKREGGAFAPADFLPPEEEISEEDEPPPTEHRIPAIKLNGASTHEQTQATTDLSSGSVRGTDSSSHHSLAHRLGTSEQTPGTSAPLPLAVGAADATSRHGDAGSDQAISAPSSRNPEPAQASSNPPAATGHPAQASGEPKETAAQKKKRIAKRQDEIIALHCQLLGRNVVRSKDELEGARLMAEAGSTDAEIELTYNAYKKDKFWGHQLTLKNIAKLLDTTVANDTSVPQTAKPRARPKPEDRDISIFEYDPSWQVWKRPGEDQEWIWWQQEFWTPEEADERGYGGGFGLYEGHQPQSYAGGVN